MNQFAMAALMFGAMASVATAQDLSKYRNFQFGSGLSTVAKQAGMNPSEAKAIHTRPALIQELVWRPQPVGSSSHTEPAKLTADDLVEAISTTYGISTKPAAPVRVLPPGYGEREEVIAQWQDPQFRFQSDSVFSGA